MNASAREERITLKSELQIIPTAGWVSAGLLLLFLLLVPVPWFLGTVTPKPGEPPLWLLGALLSFASIVLCLWLLMVFYVHADAGRRQMSRLLWTLLVIFIPNAIGFIIYFLLRKPIARPCPKCAVLLRPDFVFCPACGYELAPKCPSCHHAVENGWLACAFCGAKLA